MSGNKKKCHEDVYTRSSYVFENNMFIPISSTQLVANNIKKVLTILINKTKTINKL